MKVDVVMPKMGESIQEGKILQWLKKEGDKVERDEIILEISTDKVDTEVPSPAEGVLTKILAQEDDTVEVGVVIALLETEATAEGAAVSAPSAPAPAPEPVASQAHEIAAAAPAAAVEAPTTSAAPAVSTSSGALVDVVMPKMGESIQEGKVLQWLKKVGDTIERDEILLEISTDKVDTEVPSPTGGILQEILAQEEDTVEVGVVIARIATEGGAANASAQTPQPASSTEASAPSPAATAAAAPSNGHAAIVAPNATNGTTPPQRVSGKRFYSPLVRTIAKDEQVSQEELDVISGSGLDGRVTKKDLLAYLEQRKAGVAPKASAAPAATSQPAQPAPSTAAAAQSAPVSAPTALDDEQIYKKYGNDIEIVPMGHVRQLIAEHMVMSKHTSPHVTSVAEADVTEIVRLRNKLKGEFLAKEGIKLTFTPFLSRAIIEGVRAFPMVNVSVEGKKIIRHKRINYSFATALPDGNLIVPVIKDADALNITGLARAINDLANRARTKQLKPDEIQGGTITMTNVGSFGTLFGSPVINQPQTAIISVGAIQKRPVVKEVEGNDLIVARHMIYVSITYDHRVIDGALAGQCLSAITTAIERMNADTVVM